jgi:asparagine synthase (glutamine-hydrolysing)
MCGIVSLWGPPHSAEQSALRQALAALRHRGPDGEGLWLAEDASVALGHVRLAVIDPESSPQPIANEDGQLWLVVNGEFYGYEEVRRDLTRRGHRFRTGGDSEIALHLYEEHGLDFLTRLRGEFSLVLWDGRRRQLIAARDRFGIKPLCYAVQPTPDGPRVLIASEAKALFRLGVTPAWDVPGFFQIASMQYPLPAATLFAGVRQVRPGHYLLLRDGVTEVCYHDLEYPQEEDKDTRTDLETQARALRDHLGQAVRLRLRADVPVAFHLSGGLDSSAVVSLAREHGWERPVCFTVGFEAAGYDEVDQARATADHLGALFLPVIVTQADLVEHLSDAVFFSEGLAINGHLPAKYLLARAIRQAGFKVVLSGEGSDEILGGYAHLCRDLFQMEPDGGQRTAGLEQAHADMVGIQLPEGESLPLGGVRQRLGYVPSFLEAKATLGYRMRGLLSAEFRERFAAVDPFGLFLDAVDRDHLRRRHPVDRSSYLWSRSALANYILRTLGDGTEMAHSLEGRLPFLDHVLFDFVRRIPTQRKIHGSTEKYILRRALEGLLPDAVLGRTKHPFTAPPLSRFSSPALDAFLHDTLRSTEFAAIPFFDRSRVLALLERLPRLSERERVAADPVLMVTLTACLAQERFSL